MNKYFLFILILAIMSCQNELPKTIQPKETQSEIQAIDSTPRLNPNRNVVKIHCSFDYGKLEDSLYVREHAKLLSALGEDCVYFILDTLNKKALKLKDQRFLNDIELILKFAERKTPPFESASDVAASQYATNFDFFSIFLLSHENSFLEKNITTNFAFQFSNPKDIKEAQLELTKEKSYISNKDVQILWDRIIKNAEKDSDRYK
jgi:hypothetical protein